MIRTFFIVSILIFSFHTANYYRTVVCVGQNSQGHAVGYFLSEIDNFAKAHNVSRQEAINHYRQEVENE